MVNNDNFFITDIRLFNYGITLSIHVFLQENLLQENEHQKPKNLQKILRKSPASDT